MKNRKVLFLTSLLAIASLTGCGGGDESSSEPSSSSSVNPGPTPIVVPEADEEKEFDYTAATYPDEILVNHRVASILVNEEYPIKPIDQYKYDGTNLNYEVKDTSIATVDAEGNLKGVKAGETELVVSDKSNPDLKTIVQVIVNAELPSTQASAKEEEMRAINEDDFTKIVDYELYEKRVYKNGDMVSYDRFDQRMTASINDGYFRILETDAEIKTKDGAYDFTNYEWIFYTNAFFDTYIYHQTGDVKNYLRVATQSYMEGERSAPMYEILDNLFTSGSEIVTNMFDNAKISKFADMITADYSNVSDKFMGSNGAGQMLFGCTITFENDTADMDDENRYGIPFGTPTPATQAMRYVVKDNKMIAYSVHLIMDYEIGEDKYQAVYDIDHKYLPWESSSLYVPNRQDYTQVDSIFDV